MAERKKIEPDINMLFMLLGEAAGIMIQANDHATTSGMEEWLERYQRLTAVKYTYEVEQQNDEQE